MQRLLWKQVFKNQLLLRLWLPDLHMGILKCCTMYFCTRLESVRYLFAHFFYFIDSFLGCQFNNFLWIVVEVDRFDLEQFFWIFTTKVFEMLSGKTAWESLRNFVKCHGICRYDDWHLLNRSSGNTEYV